MEKFAPKTWIDLPSTATPLNEIGLNDLENRIAGAATIQRDLFQYVTASIADDAIEEGEVSVYPSFRVIQIETDVAARVRGYATAAARTADSARLIGVDPTGDHGLLFEVVTVGAEVIKMSPQADCSNMEDPVTDEAILAVTNLSGGNSVITVDISYIPTEVL